MFWIFSAYISFAKYITQETVTVKVEMDTVSPTIDILYNNQKDSYSTSNLTDIIKQSNDIVVETRDNIKVQTSQYFYNSSNCNFDNLESINFESGSLFTEEGYYKFVVIDNCGNKIEIIVLIDKTAPDVYVEYFKKTEGTAFLQNINSVRKIAGISKKMLTENSINLEIEQKENWNIPDNTIENDTTEDNLIDDNKELKQDEEINIMDEKEENTLENKIDTEEMNQTETIIQNKLEDNNVIEEQENIVEQVDIEQNENIEIDLIEENQIMVMAVSDMYVGNEQEFRNALANQASVIHVRQSIDFTSPIYINYSVTIIGEGETNSLRYGKSGNFIVVQNNGEMTISQMVVDTKSSGVSGITAINIESGGSVTFINSALIDGGSSNTGVLINGGATLTLWSCEILNCYLGINLQSNGNLYFETQENRSNNFFSNAIGVYIDNFSGTCNFNQNISMHDNTNGIHTVKVTGTVTVSAGNYYNNYNGINCGGNLKVTGGTFYQNVNGIFTTPAYSGKLTISNAKFYSNKSYAIYHDKTNDGGCTILGGSISGSVYLGQKDNYINTNSKYPTFTVTPSAYYFKRKLVKTTNNSVAQTEIKKVTLSPKDSWYKYVDNQYIVVWKGCNVIVKHINYDGKILSSEIITGNLGAEYTTSPKEINGYDLIYTPANAKGKYTQNDIVVEYKYDLVNCAKVTFEDSLSSVISAQYWYNQTEENFSGDGTNFDSNAVFENYGYYKIIVENELGLKNEMIFSLNKDSVKR